MTTKEEKKKVEDDKGGEKKNVIKKYCKREISGRRIRVKELEDYVYPNLFNLEIDYRRDEIA